MNANLVLSGDFVPRTPLHALSRAAPTAPPFTWLTRSRTFANATGLYGSAFLNHPYGLLKRTCTNPKKSLNAAILVVFR